MLAEHCSRITSKRRGRDLDDVLVTKHCPPVGPLDAHCETAPALAEHHLPQRFQKSFHLDRSKLGQNKATFGQHWPDVWPAIGPNLVELGRPIHGNYSDITQGKDVRPIAL